MSKLITRLVKKADKEAKEYTKFLRAVMHGLAKEIAKEIKVSIAKIDRVRSVDGRVVVTVNTKRPVDQASLDAISASLVQYKFSFVLTIAPDKNGFIIRWNASPQFGE